MMNTTVVGKLYNGKAYEWTDKKNDNDDRTLFRGRIGYRNPETGEYEFMDAVCFRDFGNKGGLVGFLDEHFSADGKDDKTGHPVVLTGYVRKSEKQMDVDIKIKKNGATKIKTISGVPYNTYEFVIQTASFVPSSEGRNTGRSVDTDDEDFDDIDEDDDIEFVGEDEADDNVEDDDNFEEEDQEEVEEPEEVEEKPKKQTQRGGRSTQQQKKKQQSAGRKQQNQAKKEVASSKQKDADFFA
ncbi:hypothetical protein 0305phi8-36p091 [Bacillus phage 0305phi8-36]|uniref:hypothetical protein n=1 Tax=Bacillus phage 0305phi8-36 TaxID=458639 RepID=UPI00015A1FB9|nr:hypothetical protein ST0305phi8-36p091 [Bacillus phage 0305phi8-36]ABS83651.1 hypothetical protein 0305phi8-36p091 [Bacillus phage 0305phi8-36]